MMNTTRVNYKVKKETNRLVTSLKNKTFEIEKNHYIFSEPRGGSTWLMEIVQKITKDNIVWEPLHLGEKKHPFKEIGFGWRQDIPENENWEEARILFQKLFSGEILNDATLVELNISQYLKESNLLFKICRGNAMLPRLTRNFNFNFKPVFLIRHPFAVVSSQLRHGAWELSFNGYNIPKTPFNEVYLEHREFLNTLTTREEALTVDWCLSNVSTLNNPNNNINWLTVNYEEMVINPEKTMQRILNSWGENYDLSQIDFASSSFTTKADSSASVMNRISDWERKLSVEQLARMNKVLKYFNVDCYSIDSSMPKIIYNYG